MITRSPRDRHAQPMLDALMAGNATRAVGVARIAFDEGIDLVELLDRALAPALRTVGQRWQDGLVRHTQERFATAAAEALLDRIAPPPATGDARWLVASLEGDQHRMGVRMAAAALATTGLRPHTLFGRPPREAIDAAAGHAGVCLSCSGPWSVVAARTAADAIAATGTPVLLGGGGWCGWENPPHAKLVHSMGELAAAATALEAAAA